MEIIILLAVIAVSELTRLILTHKEISKKAHFKNRLKGTRRTRWDLEFKKFKTQELREEVRGEFDRINHGIAAIEKQIKTAPKEEKAKLEDSLVVAQRDTKRLKDQISALDLDINGSPKTSQYPDGVQGMPYQIDSLKEVEGMIKDWIKQL